MNELDKTLYELFSDKTLSFWCKIYSISIDNYFTIAWKVNLEPYVIVYRNRAPKIIFLKDNEWDFEILWHEPQLHDFFRVAKEKWFVFMSIHYNQWAENEKYSERLLFAKDYDSRTRINEIPYNPTLPLLQQEESTKEKLISIFK
jgi:hypothetical protein